MKKLSLALLSTYFVSNFAFAADQVETNDGSVLSGTIKSITESAIVLSTTYAGDITLQRDQIKGFTTQAPIFVRLKSGTTLAGHVSHDGQGQLVITGEDATMTTKTTAVAESWSPQATDPLLVREQKKQDALKRKWSYKAGVDIAGKKGNSDESSMRVNLAATLKSAQDTLKFYGSVDKASKNGSETSDEIILGSDYTAYFSEPWGWYVRGQVEQDDFENLDLRTSLGGGLSYRVFNQEDHSLELRSGLGYRYESFNDGSNESSPTLDLGLEHYWKFITWADMTNKLTYTPSITDFGDYLLTHDSGVNIPLGLSQFWNIRFGLRNDYKSMPADGRKQLDTSYYSRLQLQW
jgi:putative salt-induced outer membrane protein YdiY